MKKILCFLALMVFCIPVLSFATDYGYKWDLDKTDSVLCKLLNIGIEDPFFTTTIRQDYLGIAAKRVSALIEAASFKERVKFDPGSVQEQLSTNDINKINGVIRFADTDSAYSLIEINPSDVGQKEINTSVPARYFYRTPGPANNIQLFIYPGQADSVIVHVYGSYVTNDFDKIRQIAHDKILLYSLYKCYFQMGETDIADKLKQIAEVLLFDQKNILENRPIDITVKDRVLSK
jgi:hypothetical protein